MLLLFVAWKLWWTNVTSHARIYVQSREGYYVYVLRNSQTVLPPRTDVLLPVPPQPCAAPTESYLTMTSFNPRFCSQERFVAYALLERCQLVSAGPPAEISRPARAVREGCRMYGWLFRNLPGPLWLRIATALVLAAGALVLMVQFLFPWLAQFTQLTDSTIGSAKHP